MKPCISFAFALFFSVLSVEAQTDTAADKKMHRIEVSVMGRPGFLKGILFEITGNQVVISSSAKITDYHSGFYTLRKIDVSAINKIKLFKGIQIKKMTIHGQPGNFNRYRKELEDCSFYSIALLASQFTLIRFGEPVTDIDGNSYCTLVIGAQVWLANNLKVLHYSNGNIIPVVKSGTEWESSHAGANCRYINGSEETKTEGRLYNWYALSDQRGLCPKGWHVPELTEWASLINKLGGESSAAKHLTEDIPAIQVKNEKDDCADHPFAVPGGFRYSNGAFSSGSPPTYQWWMATPQDSAAAKSIQMGNENRSVFFTGSDKTAGLSVRCVKD